MGQVGGEPGGKSLKPSRDPSWRPAGSGRAAVHVGSSFEDFFELEHDGLFGALYLLTGNRPDAEDVMQLAFLKVWERWGVVQEMESPTGYLYRTALNTFRSQRTRAMSAARRAVRQVVTAGQSRTTEQVDERDAVDRALAVLTPRQREAVVLVDVLEFPSDEAARVLGMAPSTLRVQLARGRERARHELEGGADG